MNGIYEIPLKITNKSQVSRRLKYLPPSRLDFELIYSEYFTIRKVKLPSTNEGLIAPGMSVNMHVSFSAPSFADFDDNISIITEENCFKVAIRARREPPVISLVNPMDC